MKPSQWTLRWVTLCGCGMLAASAAAVELPGTVQPSQLDERFKPRSEPQAKPEAPLVVPKQVAPQGSEQIRFELREIRIEGNTRYDKAVLESYYQHMLGKQVSLAELVDLANRLTAKYRQDGYLLTQVVVPEQSIEGGKVRLQVIEGYLEHVQIKGTVDGPRVRVEELLAPLTEKRPLDADTLERGLLLVGDLPGVNVQSVLSPGQALGSSNLDVALQQQRYEGFVSLDNRGSHYTDPTTLAFGATEFSRLGFYEQIDVLGAISPFSDATRYIQLRGTLPLGGMFAGDTLQIMGSYSKVNPDIPDSVFPFDSVSKSTEGSISYNHPFIRSRSQNLSGGLALQWKDTETRLRDFASDASNPGRDHVRVFQQRLTYDWVAAGWASTWRRCATTSAWTCGARPRRTMNVVPAKWPTDVSSISTATSGVCKGSADPGRCMASCNGSTASTRCCRASASALAAAGSVAASPRATSPVTVASP